MAHVARVLAVLLRGVDAHEVHVAELRDLLPGGGEAQPPAGALHAGHMPGEQFLQARLVHRHPALGEHLHLAGFDVESQDLEPQLGHGCGMGGAEVTGADDGELQRHGQSIVGTGCGKSKVGAGQGVHNACIDPGLPGWGVIVAEGFAADGTGADAGGAGADAGGAGGAAEPAISGSDDGRRGGRRGFPAVRAGADGAERAAVGGRAGPRRGPEGDGAPGRGGSPAEPGAPAHDPDDTGTHDPDDSDDPDDPDALDPDRRTRRRRRTRRVLYGALGLLCVGILLVVGGGYWAVEHYTGRVQRIPNAFPVNVPPAAQPAAVPGRQPDLPAGRPGLPVRPADHRQGRQGGGVEAGRPAQRHDDAGAHTRRPQDTPTSSRCPATPG